MFESIITGRTDEALAERSVYRASLLEGALSVLALLVIVPVLRLLDTLLRRDHDKQEED